MKTINETFTDEEFAMLVQAKNKHSWHDFIMKLGKRRYKNGRNINKKS